MDEFRGENKIVLRGQAAGQPAPSHRNHGVDYYIVPLRVPRLSGVDDVLNLVTADPDPALWAQGRWVSVQGEVRSYNNRTGQGSKLVITVLVRSAQPDPVEEGENRLVLAGALCRKPNTRRTPLGREICDRYWPSTALTAGRTTCPASLGGPYPPIAAGWRWATGYDWRAGCKAGSTTKSWTANRWNGLPLRSPS